MTFISKLSALAVVGVLFAAVPAMAQAVPGSQGGSPAAQGPGGGSAAGTNANSNPSGSNRDMSAAQPGQGQQETKMAPSANSTEPTNPQKRKGD